MVKKIMKSDDGKYHIKGEVFDELEGSRAKVWHKVAYKTKGGLTRDKFIMNKHGKIVSKAKALADDPLKPLRDAGYKTRKGTFGSFKSKSKTMKKNQKKRKTAKKGKKGKKGKTQSKRGKR